MEPVTELHRTHGAFDSKANAAAPILSGVGARAVIVAGGASLFFLLGGLAARLMGAGEILRHPRLLSPGCLLGLRATTEVCALRRRAS
jgi:hypothetical protein